MMIFIGLILLSVYLVGTINGGWFVETLKEGKELTQEKLETMEEEEQIKYSFKILGRILGASMFAIFLTILKVSFLIGALGVDIILIPTIILLGLIVIKVVRASTSKKYREKINSLSEETRKSNMRLNNGIFVLYILYILILLIF